MTGRVDDYGRALVSVTIHHPQTGSNLAIDAWIDTAFTWTLLLTKQQVGALGLSQASMLPGTFADGSAASFESYPCLVEWFGSEVAEGGRTVIRVPVRGERLQAYAWRFRRRG